MNGSRLGVVVVFFAISTSKPSYLPPVCSPRPGWSALTPMTSLPSFLALPTTPVSVVPPPPVLLPLPPHAAAEPNANARPANSARALLRRMPIPLSVRQYLGQEVPGALAARCCWPPDSCAGYLRAWSAMPTRSSKAIARWRAEAGRSRRTLSGPSVTLSSTVLWEKRLNDWNTMPTSLRNRASARPSAGSGRPSNRMVPELIGSSRFMARHSVDLPDPDGPITTTTSPRSTVRSTSRSTCTEPNHLLTRSSSISGWPGTASVMRDIPTCRGGGGHRGDRFVERLRVVGGRAAKTGDLAYVLQRRRLDIGGTDVNRVRLA